MYGHMNVKYPELVQKYYEPSDEIQYSSVICNRVDFFFFLPVGFMLFTPPRRPEARVINYLQADYERRVPHQNLVAIWNSEFKIAKFYFRQN
jgi:hypothetical protein